MIIDIVTQLAFEDAEKINLRQVENDMEYLQDLANYHINKEEDTSLSLLKKRMT